MKAPKIQNERRCHTEIYDISKAVEFGAEARGTFDQSCDPAINTIERAARQAQLQQLRDQISSSTASLIAVSPAQRAKTVTMFGTNTRIGFVACLR